MKITPYLLLMLIALAMGSISPTPYCKSRPLYSHLALTLGEKVIGDLDYAFTGYNLQYSIAEGSDFASITPKLDLKGYKNYNFDDIISLKVTHNGNKWGNSMLVLSDDLGLVNIHYGEFKDHETSPDLLAASVDYHENTTCFDALLFMDQGYAIVDCIKRIADDTWENRFIYVNLAKQQRDGEVINELYGEFDHRTPRKIFRYHDPHNGIEYIVRAYLSHNNNSYIELFEASNIKEPQILRVFDRSQLSLAKLNIADIHVYMGDIFFLDYYTGLYRLDILRGQMIQVTGHYPAEHYTKFSLFSDDLDAELLIALSNDHAIYEIKLDSFSEPYLVHKYTIPSHSRVHQISIDSKFLIVQASANVSSGNTTFISNYTYVFTKGSRTYMNAYKTIEHNSSNVVFDFDRLERRLMFGSQNNVTNYKLNEPSLILYQTKSGSIGTNSTLRIIATSSDPHSGAPVPCQSNTSVAFVNSTSKVIYPTDIPVPEIYYANYPGIINIDLRNYAIGPNITYNISDNGLLKYPPVFWLDQQNISEVVFDKNPITPNNLEFFWAEVFPSRGNNTIFYFYQEANNNFHVSRCDHYYNDILISCTELMVMSYRFRMKSFTTVPFAIDGNFHLYYAVTFEQSNTVYIHDNGHDRIGTLEFPTGYEGQIGDIEASNGFLYIVFPNIKTIRAYRVERCHEHNCPLEYEINSHTMANLGVEYFKPIDLVTSRFHPEVLFLNCLGTLVIVDVDNHENLILLAQITDSAAVAVSGYEIAIHEEYLVIVAAPNIVEEYYMKNLYSLKELIYLKNLELYQYKLDSDFDLEFSDGPGLFYLEAIDGNTNLTSILVYKIGNFLVNSLYDVINLPGNYRHNNLFIEVCGFDVDYVNIISNSQFLVYRQFSSPILVIEDTFEDFKLDVTYYNTEYNQNLTTLNFSIVNYPSEFNTTDIFNNEIKNKLKLKGKGEYTWDPREWFDGHVVGYNFTTDDPKVTLIDQIFEKGEIDVRATDFVDSFTGGFAIAEDLIRFHFNGSVDKIMLLPDQQQGEFCLKLATRIDDLFTVTGCEHLAGGVNVYFSAEADLKGFSWGPYETDAHYMKNLQMVHYLLVVTDTDEPGIFGQRGGTIFLYALNLDPVTERQMDLIEQIDSNDFFGAHGWDEEDAYLGNSHLVYDDEDDAYRLYVTEMNNGLFILEFNHTFGHPEIQVIATNYIDLNELLQDNNFHMPYDAHFLAVTLVSSQYNPVFEVENILVTTDKYHHFEISVIYDENARTMKAHIDKVYYRYGFYEAKNLVKAEDGYVVIPYVLPDFIYEITTRYPLQYIVAYDGKDYEGDHVKGYAERYMLGGFQINNSQISGFGFNVTFDPFHNGTRTGLVTIDVKNSKMHENSLSRNITVTATDGYHSGKMKVTPYNDFHSEEFEIEYSVEPSPDPPHPDPDHHGLEKWEIILIVVSSVVFALLVFYLIFLCWKRRHAKPIEEARVSLLESEVGGAPLNIGDNNGSVRGSLPEVHFKQTQNFETQTDSVLAPVFPVNDRVEGNDSQRGDEKQQSFVEPPHAIESTEPQVSNEEPKVQQAEIQRNQERAPSPPTEEIRAPEVGDGEAPVFPNLDQSGAQ